MKQKQHSAYLSVFGLAMLNVAAVMSLRGLPIMAETGPLLLFYILFSAILFLIPSALVSAELATAWPGPGGVYRWVKIAFGPRAGFVAIWLQWIQNVIWYPTVLAFAAAAFSALLWGHHLAQNNDYTAAFIIIVYWLATFSTFKGISFASRLASIGVVIGTLLPAIVLIGGGIWWFATSHTIALDFHKHWLPNFHHFSNIAFLAGIVLLFAGMEVGAVHVHELKNPQKQFSKGVFLAVFIIIIVFLIGAFSIAALIPKSQLSLTAGLMQSFDLLFKAWHLTWLMPVIGFCIAFGAIAGVLAWISGPSKGLLATAKDGEIPPFLAHTNAKGIQTNILWIQGIFVSLLACLYLVMNNVNTAFFLLSAMTVTLYLVMYMMMFLSALRLRYTHKDQFRPYRIGKNGNALMWLVASIGFIAVVFAFVLGFFPPNDLEVGTPTLYVGLVILGLIIFTGLPILIHQFKKASWLKHPKVEPVTIEDFQ